MEASSSSSTKMNKKQSEDDGGGGDDDAELVAARSNKSKVMNNTKKNQVNNQQGNKSNSSNSSLTTTNNQQGKENQDRQFCCFECNRTLTKSRHLINISGKDYKWHPECFKCNICNHLLDREVTCHIYKEKIICREDYAKLQRDKSIQCSRCQWQIAPSDWVRKAGDYVYHLACFSCDICSRQLSTGEQFTISIQENKSIRILCRLHFATNNMEKNQSYPSNDLEANNNNNNATSSSNRLSPSEFNHNDNSKRLSTTTSNCRGGGGGASTNLNYQQTLHLNQSDQYLRLLAATTSSSSSTINHHLDFHSKSKPSSAAKSSSYEIEDEIVDLAHEENQRAAAAAGTSISSSNDSNSNINLSGSMQSKSKRVRTTFTEDQLSILQTHFQIDSNPDGQDLERIATITGLSKRVTQVWFQNSRARQKKYMIKRKPSNSADIACAVDVNSANCGSTTGIVGCIPGNIQQANNSNSFTSATNQLHANTVNENLNKWPENLGQEDETTTTTTNSAGCFEEEMIEEDNTQSSSADEHELIISEEEDDDDEEYDEGGGGGGESNE